MKKIRVLVVDDSLTARKRICEVVVGDPGMALAGEAADGRQAIALCQALRPDVVTMDMMLPVMSGLAATEFIMAHCPTPILVVSASFNRGELFNTYEALAAGAVDVLEKPTGEQPEGAWERMLLARLRMVARIRVITHPRPRLPAARRTAPPGAGGHGVVAIGASTGGPAAVIGVLRGLPPEFSPPILLVIHISEPFGFAFADWLDGQVGRRVSYAEEGEPVAGTARRVVMAPPGRHLVVRGGVLRTTLGPERHSCRPSVDVLFESVAAEFGAAAVAVLLTGMGRDGAAGLLAIRNAGGSTVAQDEASSVVYGMPREAVAIGAAQHVLPLREIGAKLVQLVGRRQMGAP